MESGMRICSKKALTSFIRMSPSTRSSPARCWTRQQLMQTCYWNYATDLRHYINVSTNLHLFQIYPGLSHCPHQSLYCLSKKKKKKRKVKFRALYLKSLHHINTSLLKWCDCHDSPVSEDVGFEKNKHLSDKCQRCTFTSTNYYCASYDIVKPAIMNNHKLSHHKTLSALNKAITFYYNNSVLVLL